VVEYPFVYTIREVFCGGVRLVACFTMAMVKAGLAAEKKKVVLDW
jgi:hypothetical protein